MDGAHDMGGVKGFGPVVPEPNEPVFHGDWERRAFALTVAMCVISAIAAIVQVTRIDPAMVFTR